MDNINLSDKFDSLIKFSTEQELTDGLWMVREEYTQARIYVWTDHKAVFEWCNHDDGDVADQLLSMMKFLQDRHGGYFLSDGWSLYLWAVMRPELIIHECVHAAQEAFGLVREYRDEFDGFDEAWRSEFEAYFASRLSVHLMKLLDL